MPSRAQAGLSAIGRTGIRSVPVARSDMYRSVGVADHPGFDYEGRLNRLRSRMATTGVDATLLSVGPDLPYFTGYEAMASERLTVFVITQDDAVLFIPELEAPRVETLDLEINAWSEAEDPTRLASTMLGDATLLAIGDQMWSVFLTRFLARLPQADWIPASDLTGPLRVVKDHSELGLLRRAAEAVDRIMEMIPSEVPFSGRTEVEVARDLADLIVAEGHDRVAFTIVASGINGASPHHHPGSRLISPGDLVVADFGGRLGGYFSDSTRTFSVGQPSARQVEIHNVVREANEAGRAAVMPGVSCAEVDSAARKVIENAGFGHCFIHRTGHGIGLEVHEMPYIIDGNPVPLEPGMAFSVEPGIYLPGEFGVRIEDIVACTVDGVECFNNSSRRLTVVA